jgi:hypothetical protein
MTPIAAETVEQPLTACIPNSTPAPFWWCPPRGPSNMARGKHIREFSITMEKLLV